MGHASANYSANSVDLVQYWCNLQVQLVYLYQPISWCNWCRCFKSAGHERAGASAIWNNWRRRKSKIGGAEKARWSFVWLWEDLSWVSKAHLSCQLEHFTLSMKILLFAEMSGSEGQGKMLITHVAVIFGLSLINQQQKLLYQIWCEHYIKSDWDGWVIDW